MSISYISISKNLCPRIKRYYIILNYYNYTGMKYKKNELNLEQILIILEEVHQLKQEIF